MQRVPRDGRAMTPADVLDAIKAMSEENDTSETRWTVRVVNRGAGLSTTFTRPLPWVEAMDAIVASRVGISIGMDIAASLFRRETGATDEEIRRMRMSAPAWSALPSPTYDGDRPPQFFGAQGYFDRRDRLTKVLAEREDTVGALAPSECVRRIHRWAHEALVGETYDQRYERIKADGGVIREAPATEATTAPLIAGCPWCARCER